MAWTVNDSRNLYGIRHWGSHFYDVGDNGSVVVRPHGKDGHPIDLHKLVGELRASGLQLPLLVRFPDILEQRARRIIDGFDQARQDWEYPAGYTLLYPIKVNQQEAVIKAIIADETLPIGLEAGSKPELMAVLALAHPGGKITCNGYKDREFVRLALIGQKLGHEVFIVIEKEIEVQYVIEEAQKLGVVPNVGLRVRLSQGTGQWADTGGDKAKFGLSAAQLLTVADRFIAAGLKDSVRLLHFHMGSQIANIADYRQGFREALRYLGELARLGLPLDHMDVGGGLGVDYDGTHSRNASSVNYTIGEYAETIVSMTKSFCEEQGIRCPHLMSESGRALTAHHAVLVMNVTDVERRNDDMPDIKSLADIEELPTALEKLYELASSEDILTMTETYFRAGQYVSTVADMYVEGVAGLREKAFAEQCYAALGRRIYRDLNTLQRAHRPVFDELSEKLADKYFCNFSVFQSLPDTWAIGQLLPIAPIHRLTEQPTRRAVLQDLTCDSDGKVTQYVDQQSIESTMPVHEVKAGDDYLLGVFLVGAYQEILGDMHNLFGDTDSVNVYADEAGRSNWGGIEEHDTIEDMLRYVHLSPDELMRRYHDKLAGAPLSDAERGEYLGAFRHGLTQSSYLMV